MGDLVLKGATSGQITVTPTAIAGTNTLTLPAKTGNIITSADSGTVTGTMLAASTVAQSNLASGVAGNGPAFSAYANASQTVSSDTATKVSLQSEDFDTASCFDNTTNYRFTPNIAGYYQFNCSLFIKGSGSSTTQAIVFLYKNSAQYARITDLNPSATINSNGFININGSILVYMNGTTDYAEMWGYYYLGTCTFSQASTTVSTSRFNGALVRAA